MARLLVASRPDRPFGPVGPPEIFSDRQGDRFGIPLSSESQSMSASPDRSPPPAPPAVSPTPAAAPPRRTFSQLLALRQEAPLWQVVFFSVLSVAVCFGIWWFLTRGVPEERLVSVGILPSPQETFATF